MDRGIATKENIALLREENHKYIAIERAEKSKYYEVEYKALKELLEKEADDVSINEQGWSSIYSQEKVYIKKVFTNEEFTSKNSTVKGSVTKVLALSIGRERKEKAMVNLKEMRFLEDINKLKNSVDKRKIILSEKVDRRIGRLLEKYAGVAGNYEIKTLPVEDDNKKVSTIIINPLEKKEQLPTLSGAYVIETNDERLSEDEIWKTYMTLTRVEAAFKDLKSELGMRPIFHNNEQRTKAHLFIGMLAYHLLVSIEHTLCQNSDSRTWKTIKDILSTHQRTTVTMSGENNQIYQLRLSSNPEPEQVKIYKNLGILDTLKKFRTIIS
jgi:hypothetical protein